MLLLKRRAFFTLICSLYTCFGSSEGSSRSRRPFGKAVIMSKYFTLQPRCKYNHVINLTSVESVSSEKLSSGNSCFLFPHSTISALYLVIVVFHFSFFFETKVPCRVRSCPGLPISPQHFIFPSAGIFNGGLCTNHWSSLTSMPPLLSVCHHIEFVWGY